MNCSNQSVCPFGQADVIVRTPDNVSYHLVQVGAPGELSDATIDQTVATLQVNSVVAPTPTPKRR
jgi:hypothetical protein